MQQIVRTNNISSKVSTITNSQHNKIKKNKFDLTIIVWTTINDKPTLQQAETDLQFRLCKKFPRETITKILLKLTKAMLTTGIFECIMVCLCKCDVSCRHLVTLYQNHQRNDNSRKATKKSQHLHNDRQQQIQVFTESRVYGKECTDLFRVASVLSADEALTTRVDRELS